MKFPQVRRENDNRVTYTTALSFGPIANEQVERIRNRPPRGQGREGLGDRLAFALADLKKAATSAKAAARKRRAIATPHHVELLVADAADNASIVCITVGNAAASLFEAFGLTRHLEQDRVPFRIIDEWSLASSKELLVTTWFPRMDKRLTRRAKWSSDGEDIEFQLGLGEYRLIRSAARDDPVRQMQLVADCIALNPNLWSEIDDAAIARMQRLSGVLSEGFATAEYGGSGLGAGPGSDGRR